MQAPWGEAKAQGIGGPQLVKVVTAAFNRVIMNYW